MKTKTYNYKSNIKELAAGVVYGGITALITTDDSDIEHVYELTDYDVGFCKEHQLSFLDSALNNVDNERNYYLSKPLTLGLSCMRIYKSLDVGFEGDLVTGNNILDKDANIPRIIFRARGRSIKAVYWELSKFAKEVANKEFRKYKEYV